MTQERADGDINRPPYIVRNPSTLEPQSYPDKEIVEAHLAKATQAAAIAAHIDIMNFTGGRPEETDLEREQRNMRVKTIDTNADFAFKKALDTAPAQFHGIDAEGGKEAQADKLGEAMPLAIGIFGSGDKKTTYVVDVVEGTTAAAHNRPEAISIVGVSTYNGITKIPNLKSGETATYFRKLFAPGAFKDILTLENSARENLEAIIKAADIPAEAITVAVMRRNCNETIIREARELGTKVELVTAGDLAWGLRAIISDPNRPIVMLGRGGAEEGSIAAVAARALGAVGQLRVIEEPTDVEVVDTTPVWTADEFVPGDRNHSMVIFSAITQNTHFGMNAVNPHLNLENHYVVESMIIDSRGFHRLQNTVHI